MTDSILKSLDITNFRSIRGHIHAPLDAKVVLLHGENGAGKTSVLSAIELALTGKVQSLERADPGYEKQLLHRSATDGSVVLQTLCGSADHNFKALLSANGAESIDALDAEHATFFRERAFLPQSLLGQLLQIYQDAGSDAASPLAQFVGKLLGLDRLDNLEAGLKPLVDVRNIRKAVDGWLATENEKSRIDVQLVDHRKNRDALEAEVQLALDELAKVATALEIPIAVGEPNLDDVALAIANAQDADAFARLSDQQRRLAAILREIGSAQDAASADPGVSEAGAAEASKFYQVWEAEYGSRFASLRQRAEALLPDVTLPSDQIQFSDEALERLRTEQKQLAERVAQARADIERHTLAQDERDVALRQRDTIDEEVGRLSSSAGSLASALAEITSFIEGEICPVCDRDFTEEDKGQLSDHVHSKVRTLSASAERLLTLGRTRSEVQVTIERLDREIEAVGSRKLEAEALAELDRRLSSIEAMTTELERMVDALRTGAQLRAADVAARRAVSEIQSRHVALAASRETLNTFALAIGTDALTEGEAFEVAASRLEQVLGADAARLEARLSLRRRGNDHIAMARNAIARREQAKTRIADDFTIWQRAGEALDRAQNLRDQGIAVRNAVDQVRSGIIRREFNDRLNRLWRDLFVRLAPGEPFVPAFRIPEASTQKLQPKLITEHRDGGLAGGTPGAMLSAGNLNTAALTLFLALHLSVPKELPWLLLDDPVQSMDDVHIAHFAALLRTLSKEHGRQIMIAVHDRQLFEYLKLELSPAFQDDSLLTLELSRGPRRDSVCVARRFSFKEETALLAAA